MKADLLMYWGGDGLKIRIPFTRRALEIRGVSVKSNPEQWPSWFVQALGYGRRSHAGVNVTETLAMNCATVFACVRVIAETMGSLPLPIYRRLPGGGKERADDHQLSELLQYQPNPEMTAFSFREALTGHMCLWGNAYAEIERDNAGRVKALWPLPPDRVKKMRDPKTRQIYYKVTLPYSGEEHLTQEQMFHSSGGEQNLSHDQVLQIVGFSWNGLVGINTVRQARESIGLALGVEEYAARFFGNGANPGGVLEHPEHLSKEAKDTLLEQIRDEHSGLSKAHRLMLLEEGMKYQQTGIDPEKAQMLTTRRFQKEEILSIFRLQPHKVQDLEKAHYNNIEHQSIEHVTDTILPIARRWEQTIRWKLFSEAERKMYLAEFLLDGLLRGDIKTRYEAYRIGRQWGWLSADDIRRLENMNPLPEEQGDIYLVPLNMVPADQVGKTKIEAGTVPAIDDERFVRPVAMDAAMRILRREEADIMREARKRLAKDQEGFRGWLEKFFQDHEPFVEEQLLPVWRSIAGLHGWSDEDAVAVAKCCAMGHCDRSLADILKSLPDSAEKLQVVFDARKQALPEKMADLIIGGVKD